jgi:plasmid stabilization system protein ParE
MLCSTSLKSAIFIEKARDREFANAFIDRIIGYCESFAALPHRGTKREEIRPGLRTVGWRRTVTVAFQVFDTDRTVVILGVFYRGRDVEGALRSRR